MGNSKTKLEPNSKENETNDENIASTSQLQIRNCVRNVRASNERSFSDLYPNPNINECASGQPHTSSVFTIDVHRNNHQASQSNFTNPGYVASEGGAIKASQSTDGLPTYEEATGKVNAIPSVPLPTAPSTISIDSVDETVISAPSGRRGHRSNHRHRNRQRPSENGTQDLSQESGGRRHRRGFRFRRHLAKMNRRNRSETD